MSHITNLLYLELKLTKCTYFVIIWKRFLFFKNGVSFILPQYDGQVLLYEKTTNFKTYRIFCLWSVSGEQLKKLSIDFLSIDYILSESDQNVANFPEIWYSWLIGKLKLGVQFIKLFRKNSGSQSSFFEMTLNK